MQASSQKPGTEGSGEAGEGTETDPRSARTVYPDALVRPHGIRARLRRWTRRSHQPAQPDERYEGLAAATGLLTGPTARDRAGVAQRCPSGDGMGEAVVIDLIAHQVTWECTRCGRRWAVADLPSRPGDD